MHVGENVWSASADRSIIVWDIKVIKSTLHSYFVTYLVQTFRQIKELKGHTNWVWWLIPVGANEVWSGSIDKRIVVWDTKVWIFSLLLSDSLTPALSHFVDF